MHVLIYVIILAGLWAPGRAAAKSGVSGNPVYAHLIRLNPRLDKTYAMDLSNKIVAYSRQFHLDPHVVVAIMKQESSLDPNNHRTAVGLDSYGNLVQVVTDVGLMQVNFHSVQAYQLNAFMLMTDSEYQLWAGFKILGDKVKQCAKQYPDTAFACYHSATPVHHWEYVSAVRRWL